MDANPSSRNLDAAKQLHSRLEGYRLHVSESRSRYQTMLQDDLRVLDRPGPPNVAEADASAQMEFVKKLKFKYLEEYSKDKYIKYIVNDDPPEITAADNDKLQAANVPRKEALKTKKIQLAERWSDLKSLAPLVEQDYQKARNLANEVVAHAKDNFDSRLSLFRLRQTYPQPRYTVATAEEKLTVQVDEMQAVEDERQQGAQRVAEKKDKLKAAAKDVDRLRTERADLEQQVRAQSRNKGDDDEINALYEWYTNALVFHRSLMGLEDSHSVSENELCLAYNIYPLLNRKNQVKVTINLIFFPNSRQLANVQIQGIDGVDTEALTNNYMHANDVPGLIWAVISRARRQARL
ncbi:hypothetical protein K488DRAFT_78826 [Vararia minispora EC-137]|uniref:Uncharacterized protein n=1 Tax=Vararia minispora EC-137 TaxID=1314806 RepID=A0ACB8QJV1_9AGAM|nr:hypothetical protein K488DRAFT_78826 [Vararia minispora EC-137]